MDRDDMMRLASPMIAAAAVWAAGKALRAGYKTVTGAPPPAADDLDAPVARVVVFAIATAALTAVINVGVQRSVARAAHRRAPLGAVSA